MIPRFLLRGFIFVVIAFVFVLTLAAQTVTVGRDNELTFETLVKVGRTILHARHLSVRAYSHVRSPYH